MKKTVIALVAVALTLPLTACGADNADTTRSEERRGTAPYAVEVPPRGDESSPTTVTYTYEDIKGDSGELVPPSTGVIPAPRQGVADRTDDKREHIIGVAPWDAAEPIDTAELMPVRG